MVGKSKEDDRIERIIRALLRLPDNRRCINCNSLGPQYVCTTFWTFVCTNCSGVHREFTHRVKSVSMATFTIEEVNALQAGGNERARQIYFKTWDPARNVFPDSSNINRLRDFIKHVYVDRRFTGENPSDKLPKLKLSNKDDNFERRVADTFIERYGYRGRNEDRSTRYSYDAVRSPTYVKEQPRSAGLRKTSSRFDVVSDRSRGYDPAILRRSATEMFTTADIKPGSGSPVHPQNRGVSSPPVLRPMRELLGENAPALWVGDQVKSNKRSADASGSTKKVASPMHEAQGNVKDVKSNSGNPESLIDFASEPAPDSSAKAQMNQVSVPKDGEIPNTSKPAEEEKASSFPKKNTLEFLLFELAPPADAPADEPPGVPAQVGTAANAPTGSISTFPICSVSSTAADELSSTNSAQMTTSHPVAGVPDVSVTGMSTVIAANVATGSSSDCAKPSASLHATQLGLPQVTQCPGHSGPDASAVGMAPSPGVNPGGNLITGSSQPLPASSSGSLPGSGYMSAQGTQVAAPFGLASDVDDRGHSTERQQFPSMQLQQHSAASTQENCSHAQQIIASNEVTSYQAILPCASDTRDSLSTSTLQSSQTTGGTAEDRNGFTGLQPSATELKSGGRKELPADLFTSPYHYGPSPTPMWYSSPHYGTGYSMQYYPAPKVAPAFQTSTKSTNPFDLNEDPNLVAGNSFPSMASLQGALPHPSTHAGISTSFGFDYSGAYMGQSLYGNMQASGTEGGSSFGIDGRIYAPPDSSQNPANQYSMPTNSFPQGGGNPFG